MPLASLRPFIRYDENGNPIGFSATAVPEPIANVASGVPPVAAPLQPAPVAPAELPSSLGSSVGPVVDAELQRYLEEAQRNRAIEGFADALSTGNLFAMGQSGSQPMRRAMAMNQANAPLQDYLSARQQSAAEEASSARNILQQLGVLSKEKIAGEKAASSKELADERLAFQKEKLDREMGAKERQLDISERRLGIQERLSIAKEKSLLRKLAKTGAKGASSSGYLTHELIDGIPNADPASRAVMHDLLEKRDLKKLGEMIGSFDKTAQSMSEGQRENLAGIDAALEAIDTLESSERDADGVIKGLGGDLKSRLGVSYTGVGAIDAVTQNLSNIVSDDDEQSNRALFLGIIDDLRKQKFGASFTAGEAARWSKLAGESMTASPKIRMDFLSRFKGELEKKRELLGQKKTVGTQAPAQQGKPFSGTVTVTNKRTGQTITLPAEAAQKYMSRPDAYEVE